MRYDKIINEPALTFDDVLLLPDYSDIIPSQTNTASYITKNIKLNVPIISAAMDKVTESKMAIKMAQLGGIGIVHKNMSIEEQAKHVFKVKNFEAGIISNPIVLNSNATLADYFEKRRLYKFSSFPILEEDTRKLVGFVSEKDIKFLTNPAILISQIMTPKDQLITVNQSTTAEQAREKMKKNKIEQVLMVDKDNNLVGLVSSQGFVEANMYPDATRDNLSRLMVGAAVGSGEMEKQRIDKLVEAGADIIVVDTAHGHSKNVGKIIKYIKQNYPLVGVIAGNIATYDGAKYLIDMGVDSVKVGIGSGSICTTRIISGIGIPQLTALLEVKKACENSSVTFIADGGIKQSGDIAKALATGASSVMLGSLLAGTDETPGTLMTTNGQSYKEYRGMGSVGAMMKGSADRYSQGHLVRTKEKLVPEGIEGRVLYKGPLQGVIHQLLGGLKASMGYTGCKNIPEFHKKTKFIRITNAGLQESHIHSVQMIGDSPNYKR